MKGKLTSGIGKVMLAVVFGKLAALAAGGSVVLHIAPEPEARLLATRDGDVELTGARPVDDPALAAQGWHTAIYATRWVGYVPDTMIGKDLLPVDATAVYLAPDAESSILGKYEAGQPVEILDRGAWWKVRLPLEVRVYYQLEPDLPPAVGTAGSAATGPSPEAGLLVVENPAAPGRSLAAGPGDYPPQPRRLAPAALRSQPYEGIFKRSRGFMGVGRTPHPFYLADNKGRRIAWIDVTQILVTRPFADYLDQRVVVFGDLDTDAPPQKRVIIARNMSAPASQ